MILQCPCLINLVLQVKQSTIFMKQFLKSQTPLHVPNRYPFELVTSGTMYSSHRSSYLELSIALQDVYYFQI